MISEAVINTPWQGSHAPRQSRLWLRQAGDNIMHLRWTDAALSPPQTPLLQEAEKQLHAYFRRDRQSFDLPLAAEGSEQAKIIWRALLDIPYGATQTYGDLARKSGLPPQQVGQYCGANPIAVIIPCHRVVMTAGSQGTPRWGGYSGGDGVETKLRLLALEGVILDLLSHSAV